MQILAEPNDSKDEFQIFGDFVVSELRNIVDVNVARRTQRKINKLLMECMEALDTGENSNTIRVLDMHGQEVEGLQFIRDDANNICIVDKEGQSVDHNLSQQILGMEISLESAQQEQQSAEK